MNTLRVLVADDEPGVREGAARVLERFAIQLPALGGEARFEVDLADSGEAALERIAARRPDILLLGYELPGIPGLEVLERLGGEGPEILTVMVTAHATLETAVAATRRGAFDILAKPFTPDELRAAMSKASEQVALQRQVRANAEEKRRIRFEFVSVLAHELKAPLAAVEGYLLAMEAGSLGPSLESYQPMIARSLVRLGGMRKLVDDLLDLTRIESGQRRRELERTDVREVAQASIEMVREEAAARGIAIELRAGKALPMMGDRGELELVFNNLLTNAVKYNRDGGRVRVELEAAERRVVIRVSDTGIGMGPGEVGRLFQDFVRIKNEKTRRIGGTGLGLSIVRRIARLYGGDVMVTSEADVGSTFEVTLERGLESGGDDPPRR
jgi:two-component system sensor histidine kinase/response regulator